MQDYFELYDMTGGRLLASSATENEIWSAVRDFLTTGDESYLTDLAMVVTDSAGEKTVVAEGTALVARALANTTITPAAA